MKPTRSLKSRALQLLAQREQSRVELRRKLLAHAQVIDAPRPLAYSAAAAEPAGSVLLSGVVDDSSAAPAGSAAIQGFSSGGPDADAGIEARVEAVLDWLEANRYLCSDRFVESRVNARSARFGNVRIRHELAQHRLALPKEAEGQLQASEFERATAVLNRKFEAPPDSPREAARQARFLAGRGFSADVIRQAVRARSGRSRDIP